MRLINTTDLESWACRRDADGDLPRLIKDLIRATVPEIRSLRFPSEDAISMPGFDGFLVLNGEGNEYVPEGSSVWEMGTGKNPKSKANNDYEKRTESTSRNKKDITFVFVTPRRWGKHKVWVEEKKSENIWKDVRVIDAVNLEDWLELAPSVALGFASDLGIVPPAGVFLLQDEWKDIRNRSKPPISEALATVGRAKQEEELINRLTSSPQPIIVQGDSPQEAVAFSISSLLRVKDEELKKKLLSRTLVLSDETTARRLTGSKPLIILLKDDDASSAALATDGHHVIIPKGTDAQKPCNAIKLTRPDSNVFSKELEIMEIPEDKAIKIANACKRSVTIYQRLNPAIDKKPPSWAEEEKARTLIPAMLAGRWNGQSEADRKVICRLYNKEDYTDIEEKLQSFLSVNERPIQKHGDIWAITAPVDSFTLMARHIFPRQFEVFREVFCEVFGELDPIIDLPPNERPYASMKDVKLRHSEWLRSGLAETLLLISELGPNVEGIQCPTSPKLYVDNIIESIPKLKDWRMLASLRDQYSILIEAAPDSLLEALEDLLEEEPEGFKILTEEGEALLGEHAMHTGILWGLETLAWDPKYLKRVVTVLAKLAIYDPGGRLLNRPINTLREIFLPWHPGTNANLVERTKALDLVFTQAPEVSWPLIESLLPDTVSGFSSGTSRPRLREAGDNLRETLTYKLIWKGEEIIISRALDVVGSDPERWKTLLHSCNRFPENLQKRALETLKSVASSNVGEDVKTQLWNVLRDFVNRHLSFKESNWALDKETLKPFEGIVQTLEPGDVIEKNMWLFDQHLPDHRQVAEKLRKDAVLEIIKVLDISGVIELAKRSKLSGLVFGPIVSVLDKPQDAFNLIGMAVEEEMLLVFITCVSFDALRRFEKEWRNLVIDNAKKVPWSPAVKAHLFLYWPANQETWDSIAAVDATTESEYWKRVQFSTINGTEEDKNFQIEKFLEADRVRDVFDTISLKDEGISSETLVRVANMILGKLNNVDDAAEFRENCPSHVREFVELLQSRKDIPDDDIARIEYAFLPLLGYHHGLQLTLYRMLSETPSLFIQVLCDVYNPSNEENPRALTAHQKSRAEYGYKLLNEWHRVPGLQKNGEIDQEALVKWVDEARSLAAKENRVEIGDQSIGKIIAHAPQDPNDGAWPHRAVRTVIENVKSDEIEIGIRTERFNMRGAYSKEVYEGGVQERELAKKYRAWVEACSEWPRTYRLLQSIAKSWEQDAKREDERAEQMKIRFS